MVKELDFGSQLGHALVGQEGWLLWAMGVEHFDVRVQIHTEDAHSRGVGIIHFSIRHRGRERFGKEPHERVTSSDLRFFALHRLEKVLLAQAYITAIVDSLHDSEAPRFSVAEMTPEEALAVAVDADREPISIRRPLHVERPEGQLSDDFYEDVLTAYAWAAADKDSPASEMADANDVPVTTVNGWVKEAKRRRAARARA